jgi:hypothetical protein
MGPIEHAVREQVKAVDRLFTPSQGKPFTVDSIDDAGVVLLLGAKRARTPTSFSEIPSRLATLGLSCRRNRRNERPTVTTTSGGYSG